MATIDVRVEPNRVHLQPSPLRIAGGGRPLYIAEDCGSAPESRSRWGSTSPRGTREFVPVLIKTCHEAQWMPFFARATSKRPDRQVWGRLYDRNQSDRMTEFVCMAFRSIKDKKDVGYGGSPLGDTYIVDAALFERGMLNRAAY